MSAPNFSTRHNSKSIYAYCIGQEFDDIEYQDEKDYIFEDLENIMNEKFSGSSDYLDYTGMCGRNIYDGDEVATVTRSFTFAGYDFDVRMAITMEAGYYEGFALDWRVKSCEYCEDGTPDADECRLMLYNHACLNYGLSVALASKLQERFEKVAEELAQDVDECLARSAQHKLSGCVASNGEGFYCEVA